MLRDIMTSAAVIALLSGPSIAAAETPTDTKGTSAEQRAAETQPQSSTIQIVSAEHLVGKPVVTASGEETGEIDYLLIGTGSGKIEFAVINTGGIFDFDDELTVAPWSAMTVSARDDTLRVRSTKAEIEKAPRKKESDLAELTRPAVISQVNEYWAPIVDREAQARQEGKQSKQDHAGKQGQSTSQEKDQSQQQAATAQAKQPSSDAARDEGQDADQATPYVLVGRGFVTTILAPLYQFTGQIKGSEVMGPDGESLGEIERIMVDPKAGHVAYVLLTRGGFLGLGEEWIPLPFTKLDWTAATETYALNVPQSALKNMKGFNKAELPASIKRKDLANLYQQYEATPYWEAEFAKFEDASSEEAEKQAQ